MDTLRETVPVVKGGKFGADMKVALENDGPVTIILDSTSLR
jgi:D-tyrosyl-tRNA(Tyr) deacylase